MNLLYLCQVWPEFHSSAASSRTLQILQLFKEKGWNVWVLSDAMPNPAKCHLENLGYTCFRTRQNTDDLHQLLSNELSNAIETKNNVVFFDRFSTEEKFSFIVKKILPNALHVLDTIDLHFLRGARQNFVGKLPAQSFFDGTLSLTDLKTYGSQWWCREIASILRSDLSIMVSQVELDLLIDPFGIASSQLHLCQLFYDPQNSPSPKKFQTCEGFVSLGSFLHPPNGDAVTQLKLHLWPQIRHRLPQATLHVYGAHCAPKWKAWHNPKEGFLVHGHEENLSEVFLEKKVNLAPLRFGAGIKGKITDALFFGTPTVTTPVGQEGIGAPTSFPGLVATHWEEFVQGAVQLHTNQHIWEREQEKSLKFVREKFNRKVTLENLYKKIIISLQNLQDFRNDHPLQEVIWHQNLRATEYFSRWIQQKNST
jgi:glycosyltransferase involved in cell wall biosynthesis